jgi:uncharacterized protein with GYD domain
MKTYFMLGKYSLEGTKEIKPERTTKAINIIEKLGGQVKGIYAILGDYDLAILIEGPELDKIMKISVDLHILTGIHFTTFPAMPVDYFDALIVKAFE